MQTAQVHLVRSTFAWLAPQADAVALSFYARLFELEPTLRPLFRNDMALQREMLMSVLAAAVAGLDQPDTMVPALQALGARHVAYGVREAQYDIVAQALLLALADHLGSAFTQEVADAWVAAYTLLAGAMKAGASAAWPIRVVQLGMEFARGAG
jgi:hemoglobin-like flavoprotein